MSGHRSEEPVSEFTTSRSRLVEIRGDRREKVLRLCSTDPSRVAVYCVVSADAAVDCTDIGETGDCCTAWLSVLHGGLMIPGLIIFILVSISVVSFQIGKWGPPAEGDTVIAHLEETMSFVIAIACGLLFYGAYDFCFDIYRSVFMSPMLIPH